MFKRPKMIYICPVYIYFKAVLYVYRRYYMLFVCITHRYCLTHIAIAGEAFLLETNYHSCNIDIIAQ